MFLLELAFLADDSWRMLAGMDLRTLKANLAKIEECAKLIDRLNLTELVYSSVFGPGEPYFAQIHQSPTLSERLRGVQPLRIFFGCVELSSV